MSQDEGYDRELIERALRRLNILEYVILGGAAVLAMVGGALTAWFLNSTLELPFRVTWFVASVLLFVIPGAVVYARDNLTRGPNESGEGDDSATDARGARDGR